MKRILIVEDEWSIAELQRDYLELHGYVVTIVQDGAQGLAYGLSGEYDLIILDVMLPALDGFEVCRKIREHWAGPIIMITAKREDIDLIRGLNIGADDYMMKPFKPSEMVARVKAHLHRYERIVMASNSESHHAMRKEVFIRGLYLDESRRLVTVNGKEVTLTTKEFDLLFFLAAHPDYIFSKEHLFSRIWGTLSIGDNQTVTVHIRKIREKIEVDASQPSYIETVWGVGYRLKR